MKSSSPHLASIADRPISTVGEDSLGRHRFAKAIADLILSAPAKETLRIGIYGGWGEGKTSVLRLIETALRAQKHAVVWITPWATASREALVADLVRKLASELRISLSVTARQWARPLQALASASGKMAEIDSRLKAAESLLGDGIRSVLSKATEQQVEIVFGQIRKKLGDRKLVVMVDDLDRLRPERVPEILLLLREALDQPNYFYILALDPAVVTKGLASLHAGWDTSADFLEKIVELPRQLPAPIDEEVRAFIHEQIDRSDRLLRRDVLTAISQALSRNPRKLKLLLRYLSSLSGVTSRLADGEIDWEALYLCQMLRVEFSEESLRLAADEAAIKDLEHGSMHDRLKSKSDVSPPAPAYEKYAPTSETAARRFKMIAGEIRRRGRWKGRYGMQECFLLPDDPPLVTWKEFEQFITEFATDSSAVGQTRSVHDALSRIDASVARARGALFDHAVEYRQAAMSEAVDAKTEREIQDYLRVVGDITTVLEILAEEGALPDDEEGGARYHRLLKHFGSWAQFEVPEYHAVLRRREEAFLVRLLDVMQGDGLLATYEKWHHEFFALPKGNGFLTFLRDLGEKLEARVSPLLLARLSLSLGMEMFWGDTSRRTKTLLFAAPSPIFSDATLRHTFLRLARDSAAGDPIIAENFLTYLRMLGYAAFGEAMTFDRAGARRLLKDHEVVAAVWAAALTSPLQPRQVGGLAQTRAQLIDAGVPEDLLPRPGWFVAAQALFKSDNSEAAPKAGPAESTQSD
jgi:hypothetical protein